MGKGRRQHRPEVGVLTLFARSLKRLVDNKMKGKIANSSHSEAEKEGIENFGRNLIMAVS